MNVDQPLFTLIVSLATALFAGTGLKVVEHFLKKAKEKEDTQTALRNELRVELTELKKELADAESSVDDWRAKYYDVIEKYIIVRTQLNAVIKILIDNGITPPQSMKDLTDGEDK